MKYAIGTYCFLEDYLHRCMIYSLLMQCMVKLCYQHITEILLSFTPPQSQSINFIG